MHFNTNLHFEISERKILLRLFDIVFVLFTLYVTGLLFNFTYFSISQDNFYWTLVLSFYITFFGYIFEIYDLQVSSDQFLMVKGVLLTSVATVFFYLLTPKITPILPESRLQIVFFFVAVLSALLIWRFFYIFLFTSRLFVKKVVFICNSKSLDQLVADLKEVNPHYQVRGYVSTSEDQEDHTSIAKIPLDSLENFALHNSLSEIVVALKPKDKISVVLYKKLLFLLEKGVLIREYNHVYENSTGRLPVSYLAKDFYKYFPFSRNNQNKFYQFFVRVIDLFFSIIGLMIGVVLFPVVLFFNLLWNKGPLFYTQERVGKNNKIFTIYKLRTMIVNAEENGAEYAQKNDHRITPFGKFLRKSRLDEMPQFFNILRGEMAIIGPRPERPVFVNQIANELPLYQTRHIVKPGLTGWAQVNHPYTNTVDDAMKKLQFDLYFIKHRSIYLDINILIKTIRTVIYFRGQ